MLDESDRTKLNKILAKMTNTELTKTMLKCSKHIEINKEELNALLEV